MKVAITGATGFIGQALVNKLHEQQAFIKAIVRDSRNLPQKNNIQPLIIADLTDEQDLIPELEGYDTFIHLAARAHEMNDTSDDPLTVYRQCNVEPTLRLAKQAAKAGVKRFVFLSTIKVNGEKTQKNKPFTEGDTYIPTDPYGLSKYEAEIALLELSKTIDMEIVIIRPPLVYGPGVKANFASLIKLMKSCLPLPLGAIQNKRSFIAIENLIDFIIVCADKVSSPNAANQVFLVSDGEDVSTTVLLKKIGRAYNKRTWLLPVPVAFLTVLAFVLGKANVVDRLVGNLQVDCSKVKRLLQWTPLMSMDEQLTKMADVEK